MKKVTSLICAAFVAQALSAELICAPNFEVVGLNPDFGRSSLKVLQGQVESKMHARQLVVPSATDSVSSTDSEANLATWARSHGCQYLLNTTLTRLGETVQVNARLIDMGSNNFVFKKAYKANTPEDLHPVFQQLGNTLQDPKFASVETIYDVTSADAKALTKKKTSAYYQLAVGMAYYEHFKEVYSLGGAYSWDNRTIIGEAIVNWKFNRDDSNILELGLRVLYPFSDQNSSFYIGGGASYVITSYSYASEYEDYYGYTYYDDYSTTDYGLLLEGSAGFLIGRVSNLIIRFEGYFDALIQNKNSVGGGGRMIFGIAD